MRLFCSACGELFPESSAYIVDPNVRAADGTAVVCHPSCYAEATGQISPQEKKIEKASGRELFKRLPPNFARLSGAGGNKPNPEPAGKIVRGHKPGGVNSDYAVYPD